jgi:hypothetical protein
MNGVFDSAVANVPALLATGTNGATGVNATSDTGTAVQGVAPNKIGVLGGSETGIAVVANCIGRGIGLRATSVSGQAINAQSSSGVGILGSSDTSVGIQGECLSGYNYGVVGIGANAGVAAFNPNNSNAAYLASDCCAAWFTGEVEVTGRIFKSGGGFRIDHPLHPAEQFLSHSFVESAEMKNIYDGVAVADSRGEATVNLPDWFDAVNRDLRYQLTPLGGPAPDLHVLHEVSERQFTIAGGKPGMKICWQVTGIRRDAWAVANPINVETTKREGERNHYLHPSLYGSEKSIAEIRHPVNK